MLGYRCSSTSQSRLRSRIRWRYTRLPRPKECQFFPPLPSGGRRVVRYGRKHSRSTGYAPWALFFCLLAHSICAHSLQAARAGDFGPVLGCDAFSPCALEKTQPDLFWYITQVFCTRTLAHAPLLKQAPTVHRYGIHGVEMLFTAMGHGCTTVARTSTKDTDVCVGTWGDGRVGTFRGMRNVSAYGGYAYGSKGVNELGGSPGYGVMLEAILEFFRCATRLLILRSSRPRNRSLTHLWRRQDSRAPGFRRGDV